jgi:hypothetical protein
MAPPSPVPELPLNVLSATFNVEFEATSIAPALYAEFPVKTLPLAFKLAA